MAKRAVTQRDFSLGPVLPSFLDGDDLELRGKSVKAANNMRVTTARTLKGRMGTLIHRSLDASVASGVEMTPEGDGPFALMIGDSFLEIIGTNYEMVQRFDSVPWTDASQVWVEMFGQFAIFGPAGIWALRYDNGSWTFGEMAFASLPGGELAQPYWSFEPGVSITPSGFTGVITVTASSGVFRATHVGGRIRYADAEIEITGFTSAMEVSGAVIRRLPPTFNVTVPTVANFAVGEVVVAADGGWTGLIAEINGSVLTCVTLAVYEGPAVNEVISGPNTSQAASAVASDSTPAASTVWDEQLMSAARGYPRSAASVNGRLALVDFPNLGDVVAISSPRAFNDFKTGLADDDAIVRRSGNNSPRFRHVIAANDLILLSDSGCYYVRTRDGELLTPSNFQVTQFDSRACGPARPYRIDDAVVFVEAVASAVSACVLSGNVYLNWRVLPISQYHSHLFSSPQAICPPTQVANLPEKYALTLNEDGTLVVASWATIFGEQEVGFLPWATAGTIIAAFPMFEQYHVIVDRTVNGSTVRYLESFSPNAFMDACQITSEAINGGALTTSEGVTITTSDGEEILVQNPLCQHIGAGTVGIWQDDRYFGAFTTDASGAVADPPALTGEYQVGRVFTADVEPWPAEITDAGRAGTFRTRIIRLIVRVRDTVAFSFRRNGTTNKIAAYRPFDAPAPASPPRKSDLYRFNVFGRSAHPDLRVFNDEPGPFEVTAITQEVQY